MQGTRVSELCVKMYCNSARQARELRKKPRSLCLIAVSVCLHMRPLYRMKASETEAKADKGDQRIGLEEADKGTCHNFFNEQLEPISRGQQLLSKSPSCPLCRW